MVGDWLLQFGVQLMEMKMEDKVFFGTILALFAFMTGNPIIGLIIFFLALMAS
jgi:hypothetical protein